MVTILSDLIAYCGDILKGTFSIALLILELVGAVLFFFPQFTGVIEASLPLVRFCGALVFFLSFFAANFRLYRRLAKRSTLQFEIEKTDSLYVHPPGFIGWTGNDVRVLPTFEADATFEACFVNTGSPTAVHLSVVSVEPNCLPEGASVDQLEVVLRNESGRTSVAHPLRLPSDDIRRVRLAATIPFDTSKVEAIAGSVSSFHRITVTLGAQAPGQKRILQTAECDLTQSHEKLKTELVKKVQGARVSGQDFIEALARYYRGPSSAS